MLVAVIVTGEVLFWVLVICGLTARYVLRRPRLGAGLLVGAPLVDLVLLTATVADLRSGGTAGTAHALAAVYIGVSVGFGHSMIRWADERFAHRYAGGPPPRRAPRTGRAHAAHERQGLRRHLVAYVVGVGLLGIAVLVIGDPARTAVLVDVIGLWTLVLGVDAVFSLSYTVRPRAEEGVGSRG